MSGNGGISVEQMIPLGLAIAATVATDGAAAPLVEEAAGTTLAGGAVAEALPVTLGDSITSSVLPDIATGVAPETWASGSEALNPVGLNDVVGNTGVPSPTTEPIPVEQPPALQQNYLSSGRDYGGNAFGEYGGTTNLAEPPAPTSTTTPVTEPANGSVNVAQGLKNPVPAPANAATGAADTQAPLTDSAKQALIDKSKTDPSWWSTLSPTTKMAITGAGTLGLGALLKADNSRYGTPGTQTYTGPLSQFSYNPNTFKPTTVAQPTPYKAHYATGGLASTNAFAGGGSPVPYDPTTQAYTGVYAAPTAEQNQQTINNLARMQQQQQLAYNQANMYGSNDNTGGVGVGGPGTGGPGGEAGNAGAGEGGDGSGGVGSAAQGGIMRVRRMALGGNTKVNDMQAIDDYMTSTTQPGGMKELLAKAQNGDYNAMIALNKIKKTPNQNYAAGGGIGTRYPEPDDGDMSTIGAHQSVSTGPQYPMQGTMNQYAAGGGVGHLGGYSDGGRMLKGPGDGMSDDIPATIAGKQPARLADSEFVVPADVVSHLGNGSSDAGAKKLYAMMDRVRQARTGTKKQGKQIKADKFLPA